MQEKLKLLTINFLCYKLRAKFVTSVPLRQTLSRRGEGGLKIFNEPSQCPVEMLAVPTLLFFFLPHCLDINNWHAGRWG